MPRKTATLTEPANHVVVLSAETCGYSFERFRAHNIRITTNDGGRAMPQVDVFVGSDWVTVYNPAGGSLVLPNAITVNAEGIWFGDGTRQYGGHYRALRLTFENTGSGSTVEVESTTPGLGY